MNGSFIDWSMHIKLSVLMSLYAKESPAYLIQALVSLVESTVAPDEVVMVLDGPIGDALAEVLARYREKLPLREVPLPHNVGLGPALNAGLAACSNEWVARFDTDDINEPDRFSKQLVFIEAHPDVDIIGGAIAEFDIDPMKPTAVRKVPERHEGIVQFAHKRNPFNHMTVMYRKSVVQACGGYRNEHLYEDYALWVRMLQAGSHAANLPDCLVRARTGRGMLARRGGVKYAINEVRTQRTFLRQGFISRSRFLLNVVERVPVRLCPAWVRGAAYRLIRGGAPANMALK